MKADKNSLGKPQISGFVLGTQERGKLEVVDGKQRLTSIWSYIVEERFPDGTPFALVGLEVLRKVGSLMSRIRHGTRSDCGL
jgi:hypothetical protein